MGTVHSKLGESSFDSPQELRRFTVDDPTQTTEQAAPVDSRNMSAEEIATARHAKLNQMNAISDTARKRIEHLVGIGRSYVDVEVGGDGNGSGSNKTTFTLRTLKSKEMRHLAQVAQEAAKANEADVIYQIRSTALSFGLCAIDGVDIDAVLGCQGADGDNRLAARLAFIDELDEHILNYIYSKYNELVKDTTSKYAVTTPEQAKEVAVDIKKSS